MNFFHLSDLHIGLRLLNRDLMEDQAYILREITQMAATEQPDAVVIAGDIYDKAIPSAEAVSLFDAFLNGLTAAVPHAEIMMISGNHDSAPRVDLYRSLLERHHVHMIGLPPKREDEQIEKVMMHDEFGDIAFYLLPFVKPSMVKQIVGTQDNGNIYSYDKTLHRLLGREQIDPCIRNVLVSHQFYLPAGKTAEEIERMESEICTVGNIDRVGADVLAPFDYAALGHIHKPMKAGSEVYRYCGTPMACSVSEAGQQKGILRVEMREKGDVRVTVLPLKPLREIRVIRGELEEVLRQASEDYVRVVLTDKEDLDVIDMQERIRSAFPNLLELRRELPKREGRPEISAASGREMDPFELCCAFLEEPEEPVRELLRDVINAVQDF